MSQAITLGRYQVLKHLAQGGMAEVFVARARGIEGFERYVVIKRIRAEQARDATYVNMFLDEARLAASLHHANIVQVHDIGVEAGEYFFAMEYVHGEDVRKLLTVASTLEQRIPLEHVITIVGAAASGLHHAHEQRGPDRTPLGIVHRDVSPANILVGYDGSVKVADFGVAKAAHRTSETQSGTLKGKVAYMSPEQCVGSPVDRRADVFGLGIVIYELATVQRLFKGDNDFLTMTAIVQGKIPPPSTVWPEIPPALEAIIMKALALAPEHRYATCDELRIALEQFGDEMGLRPSTSGLADYMKRQFRDRTEPWLVDDEPEFEMTIAFDGPGAGLVHTPLPTATQKTPAPSRRRTWIAAAAIVGVVGVFAAILVASRGSSDVPVPASLPLTPTAARVAPPPPVVPTPPPPAPAPPPVEEPVPVVAPPVEPVAKPVKKSHHAAPAKVEKKHWNPTSLFPE